jgi:hypothetical protein
MTFDPTLAGVAGSIVLAIVTVSPLLDRWARPTRRQHEAASPAAPPIPDRVGSSASPDRVGHRRRCRSRQPVAPDVVARWLDDLGRTTRVGTSLADALLRATSTTDHRADAGDHILGTGTATGLRGPGGTLLDDRLHPLRMRLRRGESLSAALTTWRELLDPDDDALATAATVLIAANELGGSVAAPLERAAALLRSRAAEADERAAWSAQAQLSARVMAFLPVGVLGVLVAADGDIVGVVTSPVGATLVGVGLLLDLVGFVWMRRIVGRAAR